MEGAGWTVYAKLVFSSIKFLLRTFISSGLTTMEAVNLI